jgi:hypothetical protein
MTARGDSGKNGVWMTGIYLYDAPGKSQKARYNRSDRQASKRTKKIY